MQRKICFILAFVFIISVLAGCRERREYPTDNAYHAGTDCQYYLSAAAKSGYVAQGSDAYYMLVDNYLLAIDMDNMNAVPLCSKPNCLHNNEEDEDKKRNCDAYFMGGPASQVFCFDENLYVCCKSIGTKDKWELIRIKPDGTERKTIFTFIASTFRTACIHRGVFYYSAEGLSENLENSAAIYALPLANPNHGPDVLYTCDKKEISGNAISNLAAFGKRLYFRENGSDGLAMLKIIDLNTGEISCPDIPGEINLIDRPLFVNGSLVLNCFAAPEGYPYVNEDKVQVWMYQFDLDGKKRKLLTEVPHVIASCDDNYLYHLRLYSDIPDDYLHICTFDLEELDTIPLSAVEIDGRKLKLEHLYPLFGDKVILEVLLTGGWEVFWFSKSEIGSGHIQLHEILHYTSGDYE